MLAAAFALAGAVASLASAVPSSSSSSLRGGTYRVGWEAVFDWTTNANDPTGEADPRNFGILSNLLLRTLVGYNHVAGPAGRVVVPDLAVNVPEPTNGGQPYAFRLKRGIRFGPPVNREIVAGDIRYAIERLARPRNGAQYPYLYRVIRGFDAYRAGRTRSIAGISTRGPKTIVFELSRPAGDFLHRLTLPATAPMPREVARCFEGRPGRYGRDLVSSGPYMIEGADRVRFRPCSAIRPMPGDSEQRVVLVRNPRYDPRTDSPAARESNPDRFVFPIIHGRPAAAEVYRRLAAGELEDAILSSSPNVIGRYAEAARRHGRLRVRSADWLFYISMNVTQPPFDDVHVRRALSWVMDKAALREAWGGPLAGPIAHHYIPDAQLGGRLRRFAPFATPGDHGSPAKAKAEMAKSKYRDEERRLCRRRLQASLAHFELQCRPDLRRSALRCVAADGGRDSGRSLPRSASVFAAAAAIERTCGCPARTFPSRRVVTGAVRTPTRPDSSSRHSRAAASSRPTTRTRHSSASHGGRRPGSAWSAASPASRASTADLVRCAALVGEPRLDCYAALDRKLSTEVVPWIPYLWRSRITILGSQVAKWAFDQSSGTTAFAHVAVKR